MTKGIFGNEITHDIYGNPLKRENKREPITKSQKNEVLARQKNRCANCRKLLDMRTVEFDHIKEVYRDGKSRVNNLQAFCSDCHKIKTHNHRLKKIENKRKINNQNNGNYWINPLTGKREKLNNLWSL